MSTSHIPTQNVMKDEFDWEVPVEVVPIPSEGKVYPEGSSLHRRDRLEIKAMTAREEDILASRALIQQGKVVTRLIESCLIDKTINVNEMLLGDRNALMISIRITGYGSLYSVDATCTHCSKPSTQDFNLSELGIKRLPIEPSSEGENLFAFKLPVTGKDVLFKFLTGADDQERSIVAERKKKLMPGMEVEESITSKLEQQLVSVAGITDKNKINHFVKNMPARDSRALRTYIDKNSPGIDMNLWMKCKHCSESSQVGLPIGINFFWPKE
jgi:hypothetical protein